MENLLNEISSVLNMSTEGLIKNYPMIRDQFVKFNILSNVMTFFFFISFICGVVLFFTTAMYFDGDIKGTTVAIWVSITILMIIVWVIFMTLRSVMAPDWMILNRFMKL